MGPPPLGDGDLRFTHYSLFCSSSFNGAAASRRRRSGAKNVKQPDGKWLQWGRRLSATEIPLPGRSSARPRGFNGAAASRRRRSPPISPTEALRGWAIVSPAAGLQWGRRLSATEIETVQGR